MAYQNVGSAKIVTVKNITGLRVMTPKADSKVSGRVSLTGEVEGIKQTIYPTIFTGDKDAFIASITAGEVEVSIQGQFNDETGQQSVSCNFVAEDSVNLDNLASLLV